MVKIDYVSLQMEKVVLNSIELSNNDTWDGKINIHDVVNEQSYNHLSVLLVFSFRGLHVVSLTLGLASFLDFTFDLNKAEDW